VAHRGEAVFDLGRDGREDGAGGEAVAAEAFGREGEHALGDARDRAVECAEAVRAFGELDEDEDGPAVAEAVEDVADAAVVVTARAEGIAELRGYGRVRD
jgi:hypothetical protein